MDNKTIVEIFDRLAPLLSDAVGGPVYLVRVTGARWSYVAGHVSEDWPCTEPCRLSLQDDWALLYYPGQGRVIDVEALRKMILDTRPDCTA